MFIHKHTLKLNNYFLVKSNFVDEAVFCRYYFLVTCRDNLKVKALFAEQIMFKSAVILREREILDEIIFSPLFIIIKYNKYNLRWQTDQTNLFAMPDTYMRFHMRQLLWQSIWFFNIYTYGPFYYDVAEFLCSLEQQTQELNNTERASGHPSKEAWDMCMTHYFKS